MRLNLVHDAVELAASLGIQQNALLAVQFTDREKLLPQMGLQSARHCNRADQGIDGLKILLMTVELASYRSLYFATTKLFLLGNSEESGTCISAVLSRSVFAYI